VKPNLTPSRWAETQVFLQHGINVLHVPNGKEHAEQDLLAACDYAADVLRTPRDRIVLVGASTAATAVLKAAQVQVNRFGMAVLTGYMGGAFPQKISHPDELKILAFHGGADRLVQPQISYRLLTQVLGNPLPPKDRFLWTVFEGEDHGLHLDENRSAVCATIIEQLGLLPVRSGGSAGDPLGRP
jgi:hypothetical protein